MSKFISLTLCSIFLLLFFSACGVKEPSNLQNQKSEAYLPNSELIFLEKEQIGEYVIEIFEDKKGNLWIGTLGKGVARYDGKSLTYFTTEDGLNSNGIGNILEDKEGNLWFGTHGGLSKYDGKTFTNFTSEDGLCHDRVSNLLIDKSGKMWIGTWGGVCNFDGTTFTDFPLPTPDVDTPSYVETKDWVTEIMEDKKGNIWIGRSGYGATKFDGQSFTNFTKKEGLPSNCVQEIHEDKQGDIWFGTRIAEKDSPDYWARQGASGLSRYDGETFTHFPEIEGLSQNDIYMIYEDDLNNIWIGANGVGVYRYDGESFQVYKETNRMDLTTRFGVQSMLKDSKGKFWIGFSGGLFQLKDSVIVNITQDGPWE